jgi:hypothetical protein
MVEMLHRKNMIILVFLAVLFCSGCSSAPSSTALAPQTTTDNQGSLMQEINYPNGDVYSGQVANKIKQGNGKYVWQNTANYDGAWKNNDMSNGTLNNSDRSTYVGMFSNNQKDSYGTYKWPNGDAYTGEWSTDMMNGYGTYIFSNKDEYKGSWNDNEMDGQGTYTFANGQTLSGTWSNNQFQQ